MCAHLQQGSIFGSYQILSRLGEGNFGDVYLASHRVLRRRVALKLLRSEEDLDEETKEFFVREARIIASFHHPRIVEVYDAGDFNGQLFLALRYFPGGTIDDLIQKSGGRLDEQRTLELIRDIAEGLEVIEDLGMVHRDIKPSNILLDEEGRGTISDLGTALVKQEAKSLEELGTLSPRSTRELAGTPMFLAPELCLRNVTANITTDLYALGVTMYVCLTGKMPFQARHLMKLFYQIVNDPFPSVKTTRSDLKESTVELLERLIARDPAERFQSAGQLLDVVTQLLGQQRQPYHTPKSRATLAEVIHLSNELEANPLMKTVMEALPSPSMVLNTSRQIIALNTKAVNFLGLASENEVLGKRPGEAFGCVEAAHGFDGCGTAPRCRLCGLAQTVSAATHGCPLPLERECHVTTSAQAQGSPGSLDVHARCTSLPMLSGEPLYLITLADISDSLRRRMLNKVFFQDMLSAADAVRDLSAEIRERTPQLDQLSSKLIHSAEDLLDQIVYQHQTIAAEAGDLQPLPENTDLAGLIQWVSDWWQRHPSIHEVRVVPHLGNSFLLRTDTMLLRRALTTLLEAEREWLPQGGELAIGYDPPDNEHVRIWIRHPGAMTPEERMQLFKREAPITSRRDRGPATFLVRLLIERYLKGRFSVDDSDHQMIVYRIDLPLQLQVLPTPRP